MADFDVLDAEASNSQMYTEAVPEGLYGPKWNDIINYFQSAVISVNAAATAADFTVTKWFGGEKCRKLLELAISKFTSIYPAIVLTFRP